LTKIKICGLFRSEDIAAVNKAMPDYAGFIINFPKSHRNISVEELKSLTGKGTGVAGEDGKKTSGTSREEAALAEETAGAGLADGILRVGVIVDQSVEFAAMLLNENIVDIIQLHGSEDEEYIGMLRELINDSGEKIWKAFKVRTAEDLQKAAACTADRVLLDAGQGEGKTFDWEILEELPESLQGKYILAGGLTPENISLALEKLTPFAIDISSGVERSKLKDPEKILKAVNSVGKISKN